MMDYNSVREYNRKELEEILGGYVEDATTAARRIERSCHNLSAKHSTNQRVVYCDAYYRIYSNLERGNMDSDKLSDYDFVNSIAELKAEELCPEANQEIRDLIKTRQQQKTSITYSEKYTCGPCGGKEFRYISFQSRGLDEATTMKRECINCGKKYD
jgi:DNA-directed RNA polymerase subunit M/transcription elongation factor TFIIS